MLPKLKPVANTRDISSHRRLETFFRISSNKKIGYLFPPGGAYRLWRATASRFFSGYVFRGRHKTPIMAPPLPVPTRGHSRISATNPVRGKTSGRFDLS